MKIQPIISPNFERRRPKPIKIDKVQEYINNSKYFCLPVYEKDLTKMEIFINADKNVNWVKVYPNPKAKELYKKALEVLKENNTQAWDKIDKASKLLAEMGEYKIVDLDEEEAINNFIAKCNEELNKTSKPI